MNEIRDGLFLVWHEKLLLDGFVTTYPSSGVAMPLISVGKTR
jgi:hypothetical protein